jgi:hypothetical protein
MSPRSGGRTKHGRLDLYRDGKKHRRYIHRLVLEAFVGPCPEGMEARHFPDRDPANNQLGNLSWASPKTNQADRVVHGTSNRGERHGMVKLTESKVREIRSRVLAGERQSNLVRELGVSPMTINDIVKFRTWRHVI